MIETDEGDHDAVRETSNQIQRLIHENTRNIEHLPVDDVHTVCAYENDTPIQGGSAASKHRGLMVLIIFTCLPLSEQNTKLDY